MTTTTELKTMYASLKSATAESLKVSGATVRLVVDGSVVLTVTDYNGKYTVRTGHTTHLRGVTFEEAIKFFNSVLVKKVFFSQTDDIRLMASSRDLKPRAKETKPRKPYAPRKNKIAPEYFI